MIEASQRMIRVNSQEELGGMNPVVKRHFEPQIKTLQNAPRDVDKLERLLKVKERKDKRKKQCTLNIHKRVGYRRD
jgi:hypothetical protein